MHLVLHPRLDETSISKPTAHLEPFTYCGYIYITVTSKKTNNKRIELNTKNLKILVNDVSVYRSISLTNLDFDDDPDWNSKEIKYITVQRNKRDLSEAFITGNVTTMDNVMENNGGEVMDDQPEMDVMKQPIENGTIEHRKIDSDEINFKQYYYPQLSTKDFVPIRVIDVENDESNDKINIYLATEMKKDIYYTVKVKFYGNMTHDKGFYYTYYDDIELNEDNEEANDTISKTKYFAASFLEPFSGRRLFPCMDDHVFRTPFDIIISRTLHQTTESASNLEDTEEIDDELVVDEYNTTASMKASEVGITITNMNPHMYNINDNFSIIFYTRNKHFKNTKFASIEIPKIIDIFIEYTNQEFPHETLKYVTVPNSDLTLSEIKNGMIISSEMHILLDKNYTTFSENYVHVQLSSHLAQLWMYGYINYKTREHYWLHDALAQYLQTIALFKLNKTQQAEHLILEDRLSAMRDELNYKSTSLMYFNQYVDDMDYQNFIKRKGASILRMINSTISESVLSNAIQQYFGKM